ncbi:MAG TPA: hypothetical protein VGV09_12515 [Steroidobacteraceae bacterium]|nr:hypothetical protein [Steroidobacteraceae bacterium]
MKGIARTVLLLLCWSSFTRWLLGIGLALTGIAVVGSLAARPHHGIFGILAPLGVITTVIAPVLWSGTILRALSAPRALQLIPRGRLKLLLGAVIAQLLVAMFIGGVVTAMAALTASSGFQASLFVDAFALLTVQCLGSFIAARVRAGGLVWLMSWALWAQLLTAAFKYWHLRELLVSITGMSATVGITALLWLLFAVRYLRTGLIRLPHWELIGAGLNARADATPPRAVTPADIRFTRAQALSTVLSGIPRERRAKILRGLTAGLAVAVIAAGFNALKGHWNSGSLLIVALCLFAGPAAGSWAGVMTQGAKAMWLHAGLSRAEVFAQLEVRSWRVLLAAFALCAFLAACWFAVGGARAPAVAWSPAVLVTPLASGALFLYAQLQFVRGRRFMDLLLFGIAMALWAVEFVTVLGQGAPARIASLMGAQVLLVALLRPLARRRWGRIDWLVHKGRRQF